MKKYIILVATAMLIHLNLDAQMIYKFKVDDVSGKQFDLAELKGKRVMIVNVASKCGLTPQYEILQRIYEEYSDENFTIIGFPANNFLRQEPGTNEEIQSFCKLNYGVSFPIMSKISVKGKDIHPLYQYLTKETGKKVKWNFQKFLIDVDGSIDGVIMPTEKPDSERVLQWIKTGELTK